jgi:hypothetical protein
MPRATVQQTVFPLQGRSASRIFLHEGKPDQQSGQPLRLGLAGVNAREERGQHGNHKRAA